jgi:hypothetical protein
MTTGKKGIFLDTFFIQALLTRRDHFHLKATALFQPVMSCPEVWTPEAVWMGRSASVKKRKAYETGAF